MKKSMGFMTLALAIAVTATGCSLSEGLIGGGGQKGGKQSETEKFTKLDKIISDKDMVAELIEAYDLEEDDGVYIGSSPDVRMEVDEDGMLTKLEIRSDGLTFHKVEVGDVFNVDVLDQKMEDFRAAQEYSLEKGAVYFSEGLREDWYVYFQSRRSDQIEKIIIGLATDDEVEKLEDKVGLAEDATKTKSEAGETSDSVLAQIPETSPVQVPETLPPPTEPVTVIQYVPVQTQPPQTVYVQVPVYNDTSDSYLIADSSTRYLSDMEVNGMSTDFARYALNEIYARHGRMFNDAGLQAYFDSKPWYVGTVAPSNFKESWLNAVEKENVRKLDKRRNGSYLP